MALVILWRYRKIAGLLLSIAIQASPVFAQALPALDPIAVAPTNGADAASLPARESGLKVRRSDVLDHRVDAR